MDAERALQKIDHWYRCMVYSCFIFAVLTLLLWVFVGNDYAMEVYVPAVARAWASFALMVFFGVISITVKKIHKLLSLIDLRK